MLIILFFFSNPFKKLKSTTLICQIVPWLNLFQFKYVLNIVYSCICFGYFFGLEIFECYVVVFVVFIFDQFDFYITTVGCFKEWISQFYA